MSIDLANYVDVASRLAQFRAKHPEGSLQPLDPSKPFEVVTIGDRTFIAVVCAAYRNPDDPRPGVGMAFEPFPGKTNYTRDSELQNAETSAWGRAVVAALAADTKAGIASRDEVRARQEDDIDPRTGSVRTTTRRPACGSTSAAVALSSPPAPASGSSTIPDGRETGNHGPRSMDHGASPTADLGADDPFRPFDESNETLAGPGWARKFAVAMTASGNAKIQAAVVAYATNGRTRDARSVRRDETAKVADTHRRLDAGELAESEDGSLVDVRPASGSGAAA